MSNGRVSVRTGAERDERRTSELATFAGDLRPRVAPWFGIDAPSTNGEGRCPRCGVTADWAIDHGHHRQCPNHVRRKLANDPAPELDDHALRHLERVRASTRTSAQMANLPPPDWLVEGLLYVPGQSVLYSRPKLAKTFWALDLSLSVASCRQFMGREVRQGPVVYVVAEGGGGMGARVLAWHNFHGLAGEYVDGISFITVPVNLMDATAVLGLREHLYDINPILIVFDTLHRCMAGAEENSARDMGQIVASLDAIRDAAAGHVLSVHHAGKDATKGMRGSSALLGAVDTVIQLSGDGHAIRCDVTDQKDAEPPPPWWCHLEPVGESAVIEAVASRNMFSDTDQKVLRVLESLPTEHRTATKWQRTAEDAEGVMSTAFYQSLGRLKASGRVIGGERRGAPYMLPSRDEVAE